MALTSTIVAYQADWPQRFRHEQRRLRGVFGNAQTAIHHVGSTAVPDLAAKPEIDILVILRDIETITEFHQGMRNLGYRVRGEETSPGSHYFTRNEGERRTHKVHVCGAEHPDAARLLAFRDHLRNSADSRAAYEKLKLELQASNRTGIREYLDGKAPFIEEVLAGLES